MNEEGPVRIPKDVIEEMEAVRHYTRSEVLDIPTLRSVGACSTASRLRSDGGRSGRPGAARAFGRLRRGHLCETLEDVEEQERLVDHYADSHPGMVDQSDAEVARELLKMQRWAIERHSRP